MTPDKLLLITREGWFTLADGLFSEIPAWSRIQGSVLVITDFDEAPVGVLRFEGKPAYAAAMVDRHVRDEGLADGATHIVLHRTVSVPDGCLAFYTAAPLELWQRLQQWARQQSDHCLVVTMASLLVSGLKKNQARVLRIGKMFHLVGLRDSGIFHASTVGYGDDNFQAAIRSLATQARAELARGAKMSIEWAAAISESPEIEAGYAAALADATGLECRTLWHSPLLAVPDHPVVSALPALCADLGFGAFEGPLLARLAWWSEGAVAPLAGATAIIGLGLLGLGLFTQQRADTERELARHTLSQAELLEARVATANLAAMPAGFAPVADFARQLGNGATYDPVSMLRLVRVAAGDSIRIQRIRLETSGQSKRTYRIDGVTEKGGLGAIRNFLAQTQRAGWKADALEPSEQAAGAFSYRLTAVAAAPLP